MVVSMSDKTEEKSAKTAKAEGASAMEEHTASVVHFDDTPHYFPVPTPEPTEEEAAQGEGKRSPKSQHLLDYLAVCMGIRAPPKVLDEVSFEAVARYIASGKVEKIITMVGAGISTSAGIPDFRSPDVGLYDKLKKEYGVENPEVLFASQYFMKDPKPFYERAHLFFKDDYKPTPCHYFIRLLNDKGLLLRHYSQNIDTLDRMAGIPEEKVIEAHGSWAVSYCLECCEDYDYDWMKEKVMHGKGVPKCEKTKGCTGTIKPDIVLFGEPLNPRMADCVAEDFLKCDLLIVMGTSLAVQPFASLTHKVPIATPRLYINKEKGDVGKKHPMAALLFGGSFDFDEPDNVRDVFKGCDCDTGCLELADLLGWGEELRELVKTEHKRLDEIYAAKAKKFAAARASSRVSTSTDPAKTVETPKATPGASTPRRSSVTSAKNSKENLTPNAKTGASAAAGGAKPKPSTSKAEVRASGSASHDHGAKSSPRTSVTKKSQSSRQPSGVSKK